ncbi:MAG TPA: hypothetical protein ENH65_11480 [Candidatus Aminicenantes bacterium]|nr:hypothetical protein [Candidatus Aminicenantes bacterium]HEB36012.1 hypothetical protein [Candidatus Aminicenantes bacterium]
MKLSEDKIISAQVILRPTSGRNITPETLITAENISQYAPSQESVNETSRMFSSLGFEIGTMVGISFSITAQVRTFVDVLKVRLRLTDRGGIECLGDDDTGRLELPITNLPRKLALHLHAVTFTAPPDFGPTDF